MGPQLKQKLLAQYPEWHKKPLRLTLEELMRPHRVFAEFFEAYNLPAIRACLRQWLEDALRAENTNASDHFYTCNHVERLVEAAWLIRTGSQSYPNENEEEQSVEEEELSFNRRPGVVYRDLPFFDRLHLRSFCQVVLLAGARESIRMEGPEEAVHAVTARVNNQQTLIIENRTDAVKEKIEAVTVFVTYTELRLLATCSTGSIRTEGMVREASLHLVQNGTGSLRIEAETGSLQVIIHGAGSVEVSGVSFHTHIITYGPGPFEGGSWRTRAATVFLSGAGDVTLSVSKRLEGSIGGRGRLHYSGAPVFKALQLSDGAAAIDLEAEKDERQ